MEINIPEENKREERKAFLVFWCSIDVMNPIMRGIVARWQGLRTILNIPQIKAPPMEINKDPSIHCCMIVNSVPI
jgi:hypothetical protein